MLSQKRTIIIRKSLFFNGYLILTPFIRISFLSSFYLVTWELGKDIGWKYKKKKKKERERNKRYQGSFCLLFSEMVTLFFPSPFLANNTWKKYYQSRITKKNRNWWIHLHLYFVNIYWRDCATCPHWKTCFGEKRS